MDRPWPPTRMWTADTRPPSAEGDDTRTHRWSRWALILGVVVAGGALAALVSSGVARPHDASSERCPTLEDYAAASAAPTPALGTAPDVSFPPVAPEATPTTGMLKPGDWAVVADADGPGVQIRVRDVRDCARLPDVRSRHPGGRFILATVDIRSLRPNAMISFLGPGSWVGMGLAGQDLGDPGRVGVPGGGIPGVSQMSLLDAPDGFTDSSTMIFDVPATDAMVTADHPTFGGEALHPLHAPIMRNEDQKPIVTWLLRPGRETGGFAATPILPSPGASATTGDLTPGTVATVTAPDGDAVLTLTDVDQVDRYPGREPSPGHVFVEARFLMERSALETGSVENRWRVLDGDGHELMILAPSSPDAVDDGVLRPLAPPTFVDGFSEDWLVVEAPPTGLIRAELLRGGADDPVLSYVIREP